MDRASPTSSPNFDDVLALAGRFKNWGRWGDDDQLGTLNFVGPEQVRKAAATVRSGRVFSLAVPFDEHGPQTGGLGRFNPIHVMLRDGNDALAGTVVRDFYGGRDRHLRGTDDMIIMPLQCGTQWDALSHIVHDGKIYNGYDASLVSSKGALKNDIAQARDRVVGRGVLLDLPRFKGVPWLEPGTPIGAEDLEGCAAAQGVAVEPGDFVMIRTGQMAQVHDRNGWGDYAGGPAPGLGLGAVPWIHEREVASVATDTWGAEVLPNETEDTFQPLHIICIVHMGLLVGEIFDFEALAADCASDGQYDFFFSAPPLPITRAVGSPINPVAVK